MVGAPVSASTKQAAPYQPNSQMQAVLDQFAALRPLPIEMLTPRQARELPSFADAVRGVLAQQGRPALEPVGSISHRIVPGGPGSDGTLVRIYTPAAGQAPFPVLVYFHGGGFVIHNLDVWTPPAGRWPTPQPVWWSRLPIDSRRKTRSQRHPRTHSRRTSGCSATPPPSMAMPRGLRSAARARAAALLPRSRFWRATAAPRCLYISYLYTHIPTW